MGKFGLGFSIVALLVLSACTGAGSAGNETRYSVYMPPYTSGVF